MTTVKMLDFVNASNRSEDTYVDVVYLDVVKNITEAVAGACKIMRVNPKKYKQIHSVRVPEGTYLVAYNGKTFKFSTHPDESEQGAFWNTFLSRIA